MRIGYTLLLLGFLFTSCSDNEAPQIRIDSPGMGNIYTDQEGLPISITFFGAYDIDHINYSIPNAIAGTLDVDELTPSFLVVQDRLSLIDVSPGEYTLIVEAIDDNENINRASVLFKVEE